jgi:hypothetical protein
LVSALESPNGKGPDLLTVARVYRKQGARGLTIQNALANKVSVADASAALTAFDPEAIRYGELLPLFVWLDQKAQEPRHSHEALRLFVKTPLEPRQEVSLLDLGSRSARRFAFMRAKKSGSPELLSAISERVDRMSLEDRAAALEVLAHKGRKVASPR